MKNVYVLCLLSCSVLCTASEKKEKKYDVGAIMMADDNELHLSFAKAIADKDKQENQKRFGRGSSVVETQGADLPHGGKYIATPQGARRFGRGGAKL